MIESPGAGGREVSPRGVSSECSVAPWEEDVAELVAQLERLRAGGAGDLREYLNQNPGELRRCAELLRTAAVRRLDVEALRESQKTLETVIETAPS